MMLLEVRWRTVTYRISFYRPSKVTNRRRARERWQNVFSEFAVILQRNCIDLHQKLERNTISRSTIAPALALYTVIRHRARIIHTEFQVCAGLLWLSADLEILLALFSLMTFNGENYCQTKNGFHLGKMLRSVSNR